jgi:hypothetical protein
MDLWVREARRSNTARAPARTFPRSAAKAKSCQVAANHLA